MINRKTISLVVILAFLSLILYVSISTTFIVGLLGLLIIPPVFAVVSAFKEGIKMLSERSNNIVETRKESTIISISD